MGPLPPGSPTFPPGDPHVPGATSHEQGPPGTKTNQGRRGRWTGIYGKAFSARLMGGAEIFRRATAKPRKLSARSPHQQAVAALSKCLGNDPPSPPSRRARPIMRLRPFTVRPIKTRRPHHSVAPASGSCACAPGFRRGPRWRAAFGITTAQISRLSQTTTHLRST
jgi:hypothetical protein